MDKTLPSLNLAALSSYGELALGYTTNFVAAIVILFVGLWLAGWTKRRITRLGDKYKTLDLTLTLFLGSFARYSVIALTLVVVLSQFGVQTTSLIAVLGAAGLTIGLALQGALSNVAAGLMILFFRPFKVGDYINGAGVSGTVKQINLFATELATSDNIQVFLPNSGLWGAPIRNFSYHKKRRIEFSLGISYDDDIGKAIEVARQVIAGNELVDKKREPVVAVSGLGDSSVNLKVQVWCANADYWNVTHALNRAFKEAFDEHGISIPYPTRTIYQAK